MRFPIVASVLGALLLTACAETPEDHDHGADVVLPAELPRLPSAPLARLKHGAVARFATDAARSPTAPMAPGEIARVSGDRRIAQKLLLIGVDGNEPAYQAAKAALDRVGVPYRSLLAASETLTASLLSDGVSTCNFSGVVISNGGLPLNNGGTWESAFTAGEWQELADFEAACSAREVVWYAWPSAAFGLADTGSTIDSSGSITTAYQTTAGQALFRRLRDSASIPYKYAFGYRAAISDPATTTSLVEDKVNGGVLVALHTGADGRETLVSTVDASPFLTHSVALEYDFVRWVTKGMFVGKKRAYFAPQIDDIFLSNDMWNAETNLNDPELQFRLSGPDLTSFVQWQTTRQQTLPTGSSFMTDMAFNGMGTLAGENNNDPTLLTAARAAGTKLTWLNHTWDHENLDAATRSFTKAEVTKNTNLAKNLKLHGFNANELVTPDMSGLQNSAAILGMLDAGVKFVVSDTSRGVAVYPSNPGDNPSFNVGRYNPLNARLYQIPRHPTSIFYDVSTPTEEADEYNNIYSEYWGMELSYDGVLDKDSEFGLYYLLQGDIDPLMFHQANLRRYNSTAQAPRSLYGDWVDAVMAKYLRFFDAPIVTLGQNQIGAAMQERGKLNNCGLTATVVESMGTRKLEIRATTAACTAPITGVAASAVGAVETYAGEPTTSVVLSYGQTKTITLP